MTYEFGCYGDGAYSHQHTRDACAQIIEYSLEGKQNSEAEMLITALQGSMSDDAAEESAAIEWLNKNESVYGALWGWQDGDFGLWPNIPRPVPMKMWGKDHWSLLAYFENLVVDKGGFAAPERERLRIDHDRHPGLAHMRGAKYPTRLRINGKTVELEDHDDWDCAEDLEASGVIVIGGTGIHPTVNLNEAGMRLASKLRNYKARGGKFHNFEPSEFYCTPGENRS